MSIDTTKKRVRPGRGGRAGLAVVFVLSLAAAEVRAQQRLIGEVTAVDAATGRVTVRTDAGADVTFRTDDKTVFRRVPPGQKTLDAAERIDLKGVNPGDRALLPSGEPSAGEAARQVIIMSGAELAENRDRTREDWRARGVAGRVVSVDTAKRAFVIETRTREGVGRLTLVAARDVRFRRFAPDSLRPADSVPGSFSDIRAGDQIRALGERSADGSGFTAEEVITGSVVRLSGVVASVDAARGEVTVRETRSGQTVPVAVGQRTTIRRLPEDVARDLGERGARRAGGGRERERRGGADERARRPGQRVQQTLESLPDVTLGEVNRGDGVFITGTAGANDRRVTAAFLLAGDAELLSRLQRLRGLAGENMSTGLPGSVVGGGTGGDDDEP